MSKELSKKEIYERMKEWRNIKKLHKASIERNDIQKEIIKNQNKIIKVQAEQIKNLENMVETLKLQIEELRQMVFGKKKHKKEDNNNDDILPPKEKYLSPRNKESYKRQIPDKVTRDENHTIDNCPDCNTTLTKKKTVIFYEEEILLNTKEVIKHFVEKGYCVNCKKWRSAMPVYADCILGHKLKLYICYLSILLRLSYSQIQQILKDTYQIQVSDGEIAKILKKEANKLRPEYERMKERIRKQHGNHFDETSWKVQKEEQGNHAWVMTGTESAEAVFLCGQSRGKGNAEKLYGNSNAIGISDNYGAYRNMFKHRQLCWAHIHRKLKDLAESSTLDDDKRMHCQIIYKEFSKVYTNLKEVLKTEYGIHYEREKTKLSKQLLALTIPNTEDPKKLKEIKQSLSRDIDKYFTCLQFPNIPSDNNKAERALRHLVIKRKTSFGSKTQNGADTTSILTSILLSLKWLNPDNFFEKYFKLSGGEMA